MKHFQHLHAGTMLQAQQPAGGVAAGNTLASCRTGLGFLNRNANAAPGDVRLTCNSFERPANVAGTSFSVYLGPGPYVPGQVGRQVNISQENIGTPSVPIYAPYLQTNRFVGVSPPYNPNDVQIFWHVCNEGDNAPFAYARYNASADPNNPVVVAGDATVVTGVSFPPRRVQLLPGVNDCASRNYPPNVGLRSAPTPAGSSKAGAYLAQNVPNPCTGNTSVTYRTPPGGTAEFVVRDAFGRVWLRQEVSAGEHTVELQLEKLLPGAYHYSLDVAGRPLAHHQLLVQ